MTVLGLLDGEPDATDGFDAATFSGALMAAGMLLLRRARQSDRELAAQVLVRDLVARPYHQLPRPTSLARQPMWQLRDAETALARLVERLHDTDVPRDVVEDSWRTAKDTAARLRDIAAALESVELAAKNAPKDERPALEEGVDSLLKRLDQGIEGYRGLVAAAGLVLLAGTPTLAENDLIEATKKLAGIAEALRQLSSPDE